MKPATGIISEFPAKNLFLILSFQLMLTYVKIVQGLGHKRIKIRQKNHSLLPTYLRNIGLLNLFVYFSNQNSIWWGFYWPTGAFYFITGTMLLGVFFYQTSYCTVYRLLTLRRFMVFPKSISCIVWDPANAKGILALKVG